MDLTKSTFEIICLPEMPSLETDTIEFLDYIPDKGHLSKLGSGQYTLEEGVAFSAECDEDAEIIEDILSDYDNSNPIEVEKAYKAIEEAGYTREGDSIVCNYLRRGKLPKEYTLIFNVGDGNIVVLATSMNKSLITKYKKLIDNNITRFKLSLVLQSSPDKVVSRVDFMRSLDEHIQMSEDYLQTLNL
jgi:hypothetical protein